MGQEGASWVSEITAWMLYCVLAFVITWDLYVSWRYGREATITAVIQRYSAEYPVLPLIAGIVLGHLFWPGGANVR